MSEALRIFVWEGQGISDAYHDDGTLVVLAHDADEARRTIREEKARRETAYAAWERERDELTARIGPDGWTKTEEGAALWARCPGFGGSEFWDGEDSALDREPDRVVEIDGPKWVAFNGGGYD